MSETSFCENCGTQLKPDANYCGKCGRALAAESEVMCGSMYEGLAKQAIEIGQSAINNLKCVLAPSPKTFLEDFDLSLKEYRINTTIENKKLILEKKGKINKADKILFKAYEKRQAATTAAETEFNKACDKYDARAKDSSFGAILRISDMSKTNYHNIEASFDDYGLVLYFPGLKED